MLCAMLEDMGNLCLPGSHRGIIAEEYEDAVIVLKEYIRLLEYHTHCIFLGGEDRRKGLYNLLLHFLMESCHFQYRRGGRVEIPLVFVNKPVTSLSTADLYGLREQCFLELMELCCFEKYIISHKSFPSAFWSVSLLLCFNVSLK